MEPRQNILKTGLVGGDKLNKAIELQKETGENLTYIVCKMCLADEVELATALSEDSGIDLDLLEQFEPQRKLAAKFSEEFLEDNYIVPLRREDGVLVIGVCNPSKGEFLDELRMVAAEKVKVVIIPALKARQALDLLLYTAEEEPEDNHKIPRHGQHQSGREAVSELVEELGTKAGKTVDRPAAVAAGDELYNYETRELLFGLIDVLVARGLIARDEIAQAVIKLRK